jgi:carnosine N-methyltransferase
VSTSKLGDIRRAGKANQQFFHDMVAFQYDHFFDFPRVPRKTDGPPIPFSQMHRNQAVLHSLVREWSSEGAEEREQCFAPIMEQLATHLPVNAPGSVLAGATDTNYKYKVLVPGCGLGRLPIEIAARGYCCQGNEFSVYMILASNYMLNGNLAADHHTIHPWADKICNVVAAADPVMPVQVPDRTANAILSTRFEGTGVEPPEDGDLPFPKFSFAAGDFVQLYGAASHAGQWDCVVTCFFLDTAPVVMEYIETIHRMLRSGGIWINMGPLLYHWQADVANHNQQQDHQAQSKKGGKGSGKGKGKGKGNNGQSQPPDDDGSDERYQQSVELSYEEVKHVVQGFGFRYLHEELGRPCYYSQDRRSMMNTLYSTALFTVKKL